MRIMVERISNKYKNKLMTFIILMMIIVALFDDHDKKPKHKKKSRRNKKDKSWLDNAWFHDHGQHI